MSPFPKRVAVFASFLFVVPPACSAEQDPDGVAVHRVEVEFRSGPDRLTGTLLLPQLDAPRPAVVLLGGSDRGPRGRTKDALAETLAAGGIAVLTYDSPGTGGSTGSALLQTRDDRAREAIAAVAFLRGTDGIDAGRVGVIGGSEGARVALLAAARAPEIACAVAVSGAFGIAMPELARYRIEAMGLRHGFGHDDVQRALALEELLFVLMTGRDIVEWRLLRARVREFEDDDWERLIDLTRRARTALDENAREAVWNHLKALLRRWSKEPWFALAVVDRANFERVMALDAARFFTLLERGPLAAGDWFERPDALAAIPRIRCPVLAVWGEEDDYLPPRRSAAWLRANLTDATDATIRIFPGGDHSLFEVGEPGTFVDGYPQVVVDWLRARSGRSR